MKACWADNTLLPGDCAWDVDQVHNCTIAKEGTSREDCEHWNPQLSIDLCREILGDEREKGDNYDYR